MNSRNKKFLSYYKPYLGLFWADIFCALILSVTALALPLCIRYVTKIVLVDDMSNALSELYAMGALMLVLIVVHTACNMFVSYQGHLMGAMMERDMRRELFDHFQKLSFGFYDGQKTGQLMTRLTNDSFDMSELFHHGPEDIVISLLNFLGAFIILFRINAQLTLIILLFLPMMTAYTVYFNRKMKRAMRRSKDRIGDINMQVEDTLAGIRAVKSFANEPIERQKFSYENNRFVESRKEEYRSESYFYEGLVSFTHLITLVVVVFGGIQIIDASLDLADLLTFLLYVGILIEPIKRYGNFTRLYQMGIAGFERFMEMLEIEPEIQDVENAVELTDVQGDISFQHVSFSYKETYENVLKDVSLEIAAGEFVALVGASGVGKTTLCSLIPRFYEVDAGQLLIDGLNIKQVTLRSLRKNVGIVQQDIYLFSGTVADNIRYGRLDANAEEIVEAAIQANAHEFIMALPNGYETDIGQRGVKLSGGQKQRISIARVFLKNPPIVIFDEATSALDNESERAVRQSMEVLSNNRTTLVIAHRLSTIRNANRIVVLADDGIAEQGTHQALMALNGVYAGLYDLQVGVSV